MLRYAGRSGADEVWSLPIWAVVVEKHELVALRKLAAELLPVMTWHSRESLRRERSDVAKADITVR